MNTISLMNGGLGGMVLMDGLPHGMHPQFPQPSHPINPPITSSMNRSQRCGVCRGCQCKPCGQCTYCQDSPQFGGPGVKKQSCIERRCLRVLENRLQRDAPTFKARVGCNNCEDCRMPDCQICLVCLDKRFFENRYMTGAMCAKKRCNNATSIELPAASQNLNDFHRQAQKRCYEQGGQQLHFDMKRQVMGYGSHIPMHPAQLLQQRHILMPTQSPTAYDLGMPLRLPSGASLAHAHMGQQIQGQQHMQHMQQVHQQQQQQQAQQNLQAHQNQQQQSLQQQQQQQQQNQQQQHQMNGSQSPRSSIGTPTPQISEATSTPASVASQPSSGAPPTPQAPPTSLENQNNTPTTMGQLASTMVSQMPPTSMPTPIEQMQQMLPTTMNHVLSASMDSIAPPTSVMMTPSPLDTQVFTLPQYGHPSPAPIDFYSAKFHQYYVEEIAPNGDPFVPPSYAPEMKNAVVLQPL